MSSNNDNYPHLSHLTISAISTQTSQLDTAAALYQLSPKKKTFLFVVFIHFLFEID